MRKFLMLMLAIIIIGMSMICGFIAGIQYTVTNAEIYVDHNDNLAYLEIVGQVFIHEFE